MQSVVLRDRSKVTGDMGQRMSGRDELRRRNRRIGSVAAALVLGLWLAGDESTFVSGHALVVDGALLAGRRWADRQKLREDMRTALGVSD